MHREASRTGMRELVVRSLLHRVAAGDEASLVTAQLLAADIENHELRNLAGI